MYDLSRHPCFESWTDPVSGVESFILTERVAPLQQSFYFTNTSVSHAEDHLWFYAGFPPNRHRCLGVVSLNPDDAFVKLYPQAGFSCVSPMAAPDGSGVFFCMANCVHHMNLDGETRVVCTVPEDYIDHRQYNRIAMHLTLSADRKFFLLDGDLGNLFWVGIGDLATGEVQILREFYKHHDHAQFSTTDPSLFVLPEDWWYDKITGRYCNYNHRLWLMNIELTRYEPVRPKAWDGQRGSCGAIASGPNASHEWWSKDGKLCWTDYGRKEDASLGGTYECDPYTLEYTHVWKRPLCHAHCSSDRRYWCADDFPYKWDRQPVKIRFFDRANGREQLIVSAMPQPPVERRFYHLDPHPQFSPKDTWVVYTTMVRGHVDVALTPVDKLA